MSQNGYGGGGDGCGCGCCRGCGGCGGCGADGAVNVASLSITHHGMHLIMEVMSLWTRPCTCVHGPKKVYPSFSCQDRQLELVAAATQRRPPPSMNGTRHRPRALVVAHNGYATTGPKYDELHCGSPAVSSTSALEKCRTYTTNVDHLINVLQLGKL